MSVTLKKEFDQIKKGCPLYVGKDGLCKARPRYEIFNGSLVSRVKPLAVDHHNHLWFELCTYNNCPFMFWFDMIVHC